MTQKELVYTIWRKLEGSNIPDDTRWTYRELLGYVKSGLAFTLKQNYWENRNFEDFKYGDDSIAVSYKATLEADPDKGLPYVEITGSTIGVAGNRMLEINSVNPISAYAVDYIPVRYEELFVIKKQPRTPCMTYFYKENGRAYFYGKGSYDTEVMVTEKYSVPSDDEAELNMPLDFQNQVVEQAYRLIMNAQAPMDRMNDGT